MLSGSSPETGAPRALNRPPRGGPGQRYTWCSANGFKASPGTGGVECRFALTEGGRKRRLLRPRVKEGVKISFARIGGCLGSGDVVPLPIGPRKLVRPSGFWGGTRVSSRSNGTVCQSPLARLTPSGIPSNTGSTWSMALEPGCGR